MKQKNNSEEEIVICPKCDEEHNVLKVESIVVDGDKAIYTCPDCNNKVESPTVDVKISRQN